MEQRLWPRNRQCRIKLRANRRSGGRRLKRWLITTSRGEDLVKLREDVEAEGGALSDNPPTPLDPDEQVVEVEGPDDLPEKLKFRVRKRDSTGAVMRNPPDDPMLGKQGSGAAVAKPLGSATRPVMPRTAARLVEAGTL